MREQVKLAAADDRASVICGVDDEKLTREAKLQSLKRQVVRGAWRSHGESRDEGTDEGERRQQCPRDGRSV